MKLKFRGYDNPANKDKEEPYYADYPFVVGEIYETLDIKMYDCTEIHQTPDDNWSWPQAGIKVEEIQGFPEGRAPEDLVYFDIIEE